jgi:hypothetical protein
LRFHYPKSEQFWVTEALNELFLQLGEIEHRTTKVKRPAIAPHAARRALPRGGSAHLVRDHHEMQAVLDEYLVE